MTTIAKSAMLVAAVHAAALTAPTLAMAQTAQTAQPGAPPHAAAAPPVGNDVIDLKGGAVLRGTVIDAIPNSYARIQLATGEIATVAWQDIARITRASGTPVPGLPPPPATATAPAPAAPPAGAPAPPAAVESVWVHIDGAEGAQIEADRAGSERIWEPLCNAPCDKALPTAYSYRIVGEGIRPSGTFTLHGAPGSRETLTVSGGGKGGFVLGIVSTAVGGGAALVGLLTAAVGAAITESGDDGSGTETTGWVITAVGAAAIVGGIILIVTNARSHVSQDTSTATNAALPRPVMPAPEWARIPGLGGHDVLTSALPAAVTMPVFTMHF